MTCICTARVKHLHSTTQDHQHDRPITVQISAPLKRWEAKITPHSSNITVNKIKPAIKIIDAALANECKAHSLNTPPGMPADKPPS